MKKSMRAFALAAALVMAVCAFGCGEKPEPAFTVAGSITLKEGFTSQITPSGVKGIESFSYLSLDDAVATVTDDGLVTAVKSGTTTVTVAGGGLTKDISVIVEANLVNGLSVKKLDAVSAFSEEQSAVENAASGVWNFGWDVDITAERLARKFDFVGTSRDTDVILRGMSSTEKYSSFDNGGFAIVMIAGTNTALTEQTMPEGSHATVYGKTRISAKADAFRLWGCSWKDDIVSGKGSFRVVAYTADAANHTYRATPLTAAEKGELEQDGEGWISFEDVSMPTGNIVGAPADTMFVFEAKNDSYDLAGKEAVIAVEFRATANTLGADEVNKQCRFGIKRMGFMLAPDPGFNITSGQSVSLAVGRTSQIVAEAVGGLDEENFTYASSATGIADVSATGLITAKAVGTAVVTVKNGELEKTVNVTVNNGPAVLPSILGVDNAKLKALTAFSADAVNIDVSGANALNFVSSWGATGANADKISLDDSAANTLAILRVANKQNAVVNVEENWVDMILMPTQGTTETCVAVYSKMTVPDQGHFRAWTYAAPAGGEISGKGKFRIVFYLPNANYTEFTPYTMACDFQEQDTWATEKHADGYVSYSNGVDGFFGFVVPAEVKGKEVIMAVELVGGSADKQDRFAFKRLGFTA